MRENQTTMQKSQITTPKNHSKPKKNSSYKLIGLSSLTHKTNWLIKVRPKLFMLFLDNEKEQRKSFKFQLSRVVQTLPQTWILKPYNFFNLELGCLVKNYALLYLIPCQGIYFEI